MRVQLELKAAALAMSRQQPMKSALYTLSMLVTHTCKPCNKLARYTTMPPIAENGCVLDMHNRQEQQSPVKCWSYLIG